ncbi:MAG: deoxyguanosinetriphosphate triphosphohydrolase [Nitrospinae bacterium]|nr:deoxyguanosinetriphosphate triphosphohydrolase [Nitrospinota bacterium]MBF0635479.1 deoxyguanosinetriphosphate triphosphohydrolase [Nitrospinota bacterium]
MLRNRAEAERIEEENLASYASLSGRSRGRRHPQEEPAFRTAYMRDRDRIIHCAAFRRLEYKTQVFVYHEGDHYRTRLTHTIEVAQIARSMARTLRLNEDLCEAIALSHDIGHPPFGHSGEKALDALMREDGGFEHNAHALRIVDHIENKYTGFRGLNLTWETREAIAKHSKRSGDSTMSEFAQFQHPSLEAQVVDISDAIAYNSHDLDDGLESGLLAFREMENAPLWRRFHQTIMSKEGMTPKIARHYIIRRIINAQVEDALNNTANNIRMIALKKADDARRAPWPVVSFSPEMDEEHRDLKKFLKANMYSHHRVLRMEEKAYGVVSGLFTKYDRKPELLPPHVSKRLATENRRRLICDYIAGMTDKYALEEYQKLFDPSARV